MCGIARNLPRRAGAAPVVDQAAGGNAQVTVQQGVVAEVELLVHEGGLELGVQVGEQLAAADEEVMAAQVAVGGEFGLVQVFDVAQGFADLPQALVQHVLGQPQRGAGGAEDVGDLGLVPDHEIRFLLAQRFQGRAYLSGGGHQLGFFAQAGGGVEQVADHEDFPCLETLGMSGVERLEAADEVGMGLFGEEVRQQLLETHAALHDMEAGLQLGRALEQAG